MKKFAIGLIAASMALVSSVSLAENNNSQQTQTNNASMMTVLNNLQKQGYVAVRKIKLDDNIYKAEAVDKLGRKIDVKVNAQTGSIQDPQTPPVKITMMDALKKAQASGLQQVTDIEATDKGFELEAINKDGKKVDFNIDINNMSMNQ
jgi:uncharacterized membrane protein YkoI